jgi:exodeoxyribonuclease VII small subunit
MKYAANRAAPLTEKFSRFCLSARLAARCFLWRQAKAWRILCVWCIAAIWQWIMTKMAYAIIDKALPFSAKETDMADKIEISEDILQLSFEEALSELETIVDRLETGDVALEESIEIYKRGSQLRAFCDEKLKSAQAKIEKITGNGGTASGTEPLDAD